MDPWYFNRLSNASATFQSGSGANASDYHQQLTGHTPTPSGNSASSSTQQLLLQAAAHNTSHAVPPPFNPAFLTPNPYDFSLFSHASKTSPYTAAAVSQHRALASAISSSKATPEGPLSSHRENYSPAHHASSASSSNSPFFEHQNSASSSVGWSHEGNSLPSPFGILPHESVTPSSTDSSKAAATDFAFNAYSSSHGLNLPSQLPDYKNYPDAKKVSRSQSPPAPPKESSASSSTSPYYPGSSITSATNNYASSNPSSRSAYSGSGKYNVVPQQSCIVSSPSVTPPSKDYRVQQPATRTESSSVYQDTSVNRNKLETSRSPSFIPPSTKSSRPQHSILTKAQSKIYSDLASTTEPLHHQRSEAALDSNQTSPTMMDASATHRYAAGNGGVSNTAKQLSTSSHSQQGNQQPYQQALSHQATAYGHYSGARGAPEADYNSPKSSVESAYSTTSQQNGPECATRRTSPHVSHSQPSPLGHVPSPAYPMYNSPMAPMPSPSPLQHSESNNPSQQNNNNPYKAAVQVNDSTAPIDVPVTRSHGGQPQNVAYPSVITRALTTPETEAKPSGYDDTRPYDRGHDPSAYSKQCWDAGSERLPSVPQQQTSGSLQQKYQSPSSVPAYNANTQDIAAIAQQPQQNTQRATERPQSYYDSTAANPAGLQDPSSCRGDPMSIVKNLQSMQQQTCLAPQSVDDSKSGSKTPRAGSNSPNSTNKRRKSVENQAHTPMSSDYYDNRVPPPAHHNASTQQQQNGSYFSNYLSSPSTSRPYSCSQTQLHHASNASLGNQSQGIYTNPYFPPFHLSGPATSSASSITSVQHTGASDYQTCSAPSESVQPQVPKAAVGETPKVIVPDIEEELSFLANVGPIMMVKKGKEGKQNAASGFEASYLKFLQGERETSPPPSNRGVRKTTWTKAKGPSTGSPAAITSSNSVSNGGNVPPTKTRTTVNTTKDKTPVYDLEDDPRYFPLPKTDAQRRSFDTSESDSDTGTGTKSRSFKTQDRKPIAAVAPRTANKQASKATANHQPGKRGRKKKPEVPMPRRETSKRKAKEKGSILLNEDDPDDPDDPDDLSDSDSDPAWTPVAFKTKTQNIDSSEDENTKKKSYKKGSKPSLLGRKRVRTYISDDATSEEEEAKPKKRATSGLKGRKRSLQSASGNSSSVKSEDDTGADGDENDMYPFKVGEFMVIKSDLSEQWPPIWRVDGKTLLQKFEPFEQEGERLYRNSQTYAGWSAQNRHLYRPISIKFRTSSRVETIVEFLQNELIEENEDVLESYVKETAKFQDNFEVYIQTLISQALDSNFLTEIFQEKDEYFLTNVKTVDDIVDDRRQRFLHIVKWRTELEASIATWPCYNVMLEQELADDDFHKNCAACDKPGVAARVILYGQPYNSTTLEGCQADPKLVSEKDFLTCRLCLSRIELYNKVAHQKYLMFIECAKRVQEKRLGVALKDTTVILNELLADEKWLNQLFRKVRISWAEIDHLEQTLLKK